MPILNSINQMLNEMTEWRQDLHKIPEIGLEEYETSKYIKNKLKEFGINYKEGYAGTGVVAWVEGAKNESGKSIGLRADFDALPMTEENNFKHKSTNEGMMHACGHDGHTTMLLGAAKYLSENNDFNGKVYFIFQPGEEGFSGGKKMIEDGMFDDFKIDEVYALHNWPELPLGQFGVNSGPMMAAVDEFDITVFGKGGHAAMPHRTIDPIVIASQIINSIQTIISRSVDPVDKALISVTKINAGSAHNVISNEATFGGTIRTFRKETRSYIEDRIKEISVGIAKAHGAEVNIKFDLINKYPPTINSKKETKFASEVAKEVAGENNVFTDIDPCMGGEDFSYLLEEKPGTYLFLGQGDDNHKANVHTTKYDFNDNLLPIGVNFWVELVKKYFK